MRNDGIRKKGEIGGGVKKKEKMDEKGGEKSIGKTISEGIMPLIFCFKELLTKP